MATLHLTLLGGFRARLDPGGPLSLPTRKAQALVAYLALTAQAQPRDKLVSLLWGDVRETQGRASLRQALFGLRRATASAGALRLEADAVGLAPAAIQVDAHRFEEHANRQTPEAWAAAAALYQGDLLSGLALREPPFEEWLLAERERLRELAMEALARLLGHRRATGAGEPAIQTALRLLVLDPLQEPVHRTLMRLYVEAGRRAAALRQYQTCVSSLQRELSTEPEAATKALYQQILATRSGPAGRADASDAPPLPQAGSRLPEVAPAELPLVGREAEMARLEELLDRVWEGDGLVVSLDGEAGVGKSRLAAEVATLAQHRGGRVIVGRCYETERILPFAPWTGALRGSGVARDAALLGGLAPAWRAELSHLLPEAAGPDAPVAGGEAARAFEAVAEVLEALAGRQPLVVVLEDIQWADETSVRLIAFLGRRLQGRRILLLATGRLEDTPNVPILRQTRQELERAGRIVSLPLAALSRDATIALAHRLLPAGVQRTDPVMGDDIWRASEGNPFLVLEIMRAVEDRRPPGVTGRLPLTARVHALVTDRLDRLSERGRRLVDAAATIGRQFEFALGRYAAGLEEDEGAAGVEELVRGRILQQSGEGFEFAHDWLREVAYAVMLVPRRTLLHRRVAEALEQLHAGDLDRHALAVGSHYRAGGLPERAAEHLVRAAVTALARGAPGEALACCDEALGALEGSPVTADVNRRRSDLHLQAGHALFWSGRLEEGIARYRSAEAAARAVGDDDRLARVAVAVTRLLGGGARYREALATGEGALAIAQRLGDRSLQVWARGGLCPARFALGAYRSAMADAQATLEALPGAALGERPAAAGVMPDVAALGWLAQCAARLGEFDAGVGWGREALRAAEERNHQPASAFARYSLGQLLLERGDFEGAVAVLEPGVEMALVPIRPRILAALAAALAHSGSLERADALLARAFDTVRATPFLYGHSQTLAHQVTVHLLDGRVGAARATCEELLAYTRERGQRGDEAWALLLAGEARARGTPGDGEAARAWEEALALAIELEMRPLEARCRMSLAAGAPTAVDSAAKLTLAATAFHAMAMRPWLEEARRLLHAAAR